MNAVGNAVQPAPLSLNDLLMDVATVVALHSDARSLASLSLTCRHWHSACEIRLAEMFATRLKSLAKGLASMATLNRSMTNISQELTGMRHADRTLLCWLATSDPHPLLQLDTQEAKLSSWLLMRLASSGTSLLEILEDQEHAYAGVVWS